MDTLQPAPSPSPPWRMLLAVGLVALLVRLLHAGWIVADPLYWNPLGGNLPYLLLAERIAGGELVPFDGPISLNSPLYPYVLAGLYQVVGVGDLHGVRLAGAAVDAGTCALVALLAWRRFGPVAGWGAGVALALYGPMIFFALDLNPVPWTLFLLTAGIVLLDGPGRTGRFLLAGLLLGLAAGTRPNVLLAGVLALSVPWARRLPAMPRLTGAVAVGLALGVAPVTLLNVAASGEPVLLTTSAGHNFYIGHNPAAEAQYTLPAALDGDIFASMKGLAEEAEGRSMEDTEVSGWYLRRGLAHAAANPGREAELLARRALLLVNDFEATTYASYEYQRVWSTVLRFAPTLSWLLLLAVPGMLLALRREHLHLWIPLLTAAATVLLFFYIARLRVIMVPSLGVFAGAAVGRAVTLLGVRRGAPAKPSGGEASEQGTSDRGMPDVEPVGVGPPDRGVAPEREGPPLREWRPVAAAGAVGLLAFALAHIPLLTPDTSNEWNKAGGVLRAAGLHEESEDALRRAREANPANPDTWRNLAALYRETGRPDEAARADSLAEALSRAVPSEAAAFRRRLIDP